MKTISLHIVYTYYLTLTNSTVTDYKILLFEFNQFIVQLSCTTTSILLNPCKRREKPPKMGLASYVIPWHSSYWLYKHELIRGPSDK